MALEVVLIIEDTDDHARLAQRVIHAHNPQAAIIIYPTSELALAYLHNLENRVPDIILLDLGLPRMDGLEFLRKIRHRQRTGKVPVIIVTGLERGAQAVAEAFSIGVDGYLLKPITSTSWKELLTKLGLDT